ncbi:MAG TPA: alpha/beta fold hydrolase [Puia sp.]|nr:alpha/beta fold hydrolase [Puia sp.]
MSEHFIPFRSSRFHYCTWGTGSRLLFAFHGYGESAATFAFLGDALGNDFTIIAPDLPFHGKTEWNEDRHFLDPRDLLSLMAEIAAAFPGREAGWWLLGYSMGGRVALQLLELAPEKVRRLVLIAPDGLIVNSWYWLATQTRVGNALFHRAMRSPGWLFLLMRTGNRLQLVNPSLYKFAVHYIDDDAARRSLYTRWTTMRGFRPRLGPIAAIIRDRQIPVVLLYGSYDRIIRSERGEHFRQRIAPWGRLTLLSAGHQLLQPKFMEVIANALYLPII